MKKLLFRNLALSQQVLFFVPMVLLSNQLQAQSTGHQHGVASLQIILEGAQLSMDFDSPLDNVLGFEHAPKTEAETQAVQRLIENLRNVDKIALPSPEAKCQLQTIKLNAPTINLKEISDQKVSADHHDEHADLSMSVKWLCTNLNALRVIDVALFKSFPGLHQIDAQLVGPKGQSARKLTPQQMQLTW
jgi:hypothetical protein